MQAANRVTTTRSFAGQTITHEVICGVYLIICTVTGEMYVGSSVDIRRRWRQHRSLLRGGRSNCTNLQAAWDQHPERFSFAILRECAENDLHIIEQEYMDRLTPVLNSTPRAGTTLGKRMSAEQRVRLRQRPQSIARTYLFQGEMRTVNQIAAAQGCSVATLYSRLRAGGSLEAPIANRLSPPIDVGGRMLTPREISEEFDLPLTSVYSRINLGWSGSDLTKPAGPGGRKRRG